MGNLGKTILIIIILMFIIILDLFLYFKTDKLISNTEEVLSKLEKNIENKQKAEELKNEWDKHEKALSFFIEHDELEKVSSKIVVINENIKNKEYETALEDLVEAKYMLEKIKERYDFNLKNIF